MKRSLIIVLVVSAMAFCACGKHQTIAMVASTEKGFCYQESFSGFMRSSSSPKQAAESYSVSLMAQAGKKNLDMKSALMAAYIQNPEKYDPGIIAVAMGANEKHLVLLRNFNQRSQKIDLTGYPEINLPPGETVRLRTDDKIQIRAMKKDGTWTEFQTINIEKGGGKKIDGKSYDHVINFKDKS